MRPAALHDDPRRPSASCCCCCGCCGRGPRPRRPRLALWLRRMLCLGAEAAAGSSPASSATPGGLNAASDTMLLDSSDQELIVVSVPPPTKIFVFVIFFIFLGANLPPSSKLAPGVHIRCRVLVCFSSGCATPASEWVFAPMEISATPQETNFGPLRDTERKG